MGKKRRGQAEVAAAVKQIDKLIAGGMNVQAACDKMKLSSSVYGRAKKMNGGTTGSVRADSLPPRPKKQATGKRARLNMHDIAAVGKAIKRLDQRLATYTDLRAERALLADAMLGLLKKS